MFNDLRATDLIPPLKSDHEDSMLGLRTSKGFYEAAIILSVVSVSRQSPKVSMSLRNVDSVFSLNEAEVSLLLFSPHKTMVFLSLFTLQTKVHFVFKTCMEFL